MEKLMCEHFSQKIIEYGFNQLKKKPTCKCFGLNSVFQKRMIYVHTNFNTSAISGEKICNGLFFYFIMIKICCDERSLRESNFQVHNLTTYIPSLQVEFINNCIFSYNIHISCTIFVVSQKRIKFSM